MFASRRHGEDVIPPPTLHPINFRGGEVVAQLARARSLTVITISLRTSSLQYLTICNLNRFLVPERHQPIPCVSQLNDQR